MSRHVLDELFDESVYEQLKARHIAIDKVGAGFGKTGWLDEHILQALHGSEKTFHTRDHGFYRRSGAHASKGSCVTVSSLDAFQGSLFLNNVIM